MSILQFRRTVGGGVGGGEINSASNVNASGIGVFKQKSTDNLEFKGIVAGSALVSVTEDTTDNIIIIDFEPGGLALTDFGGSIDLGGVQASGLLAAARFPGLTGVVDVAEGTLETTIADGSLLTAMLADNAVGNLKSAKMPATTLKGNPTGALANAQDITVVGGLTFAGTTLKSKSSFSFSYQFDTATTATDPTAGFMKLNAASTHMYISKDTAEGLDISLLLEDAVNGTISYISNNFLGDGIGKFTITAFTDNTTWYDLTITTIPGFGVLPADNEDIVVSIVSGSTGLTSQDVLDMLVLRRNEFNQIIDETGAVLSGTNSVADYAALVALDPAEYSRFVMNMASGMNNAYFASNDVSWSPLNGQYVHARTTTPGVFIIGANNVTWTAADNGSGKVRLTSSGVHGLTTSPAVGCCLQQTGSATGWTPNTNHEIATIVDTTHIDLTTNYTASMGVPVFKYAGTTEANSEVTHRDITLPVLRNNSEVEAWYDMEVKGTPINSDAKRFKVYLGATELVNYNNTAVISSFPFRHGFANTGATNSQLGITGFNSTGFAQNTTAPATAAIDTSVAGAVLSIRTMIETVNVGIRINASKTFIRG